MKHTLFSLLVAALVACLPLSALGAAAPEVTTQQLSGLIQQVGESHLLMTDAQLGEVRVNITEKTQLEGIYPEAPMEAGQYITVTYNGVTTRSMPPQVHGDRVACFRLEGTVAELRTGGFLLTGDAVQGQAIVNLPEGFPQAREGMNVTVYYNGIMALSMPPQVSASHLVLPTVTGVVVALGDENTPIGLVDDMGVLYTISLENDTLFEEGLTMGQVEVGTRLSITYSGQQPGGLEEAADGVQVQAVFIARGGAPEDVPQVEDPTLMEAGEGAEAP